MMLHIFRMSIYSFIIMSLFFLFIKVDCVSQTFFIIYLLVPIYSLDEYVPAFIILHCEPVPRL